MRRILISSFWILVAATLCLHGCRGKAPDDPASGLLQARLNADLASQRLLAGSDSISSPGLVRGFYERRGFQPAWSSELGPSPQADSLVEEIRSSDRHGLDPAEYHLSAIEATRAWIDSSEEQQGDVLLSLRADFDILLTDSYMLYASHLLEGKISRDSLTVRSQIGVDWDRWSSMLESALMGGTVGPTLRAFAPSHRMYGDLCDLLRTYKEEVSVGRWRPLSPAAIVRPGDHGATVVHIRDRLRRLGDLTAPRGSAGGQFDSTLAEAVRRFQRRHGLEPTGLIDSLTLAALNVSPTWRVEQIKANLERWRWLSHKLGSRHMRVNIPDFTLTVSEEDRDVTTMKVVVGKADWQTPVFSSEMNQIMFNAPWLAPKNIVEDELIEYMKADSDYLRRNEMSLWREDGDSLVMIHLNPAEIAGIEPKEITFRLRQEGGPQNIMGQVKFLIPNANSIYLHDTPYREDFAKRVRTFSHGCIRLERPFDLAEYVLSERRAWKRNDIDSVVAGKREHSIFLRNTIPVHIVYCTVWRDQDGLLQFREDCYGLDRLLSTLLSDAPPLRSISKSGSAH